MLMLYSCCYGRIEIAYDIRKNLAFLNAFRQRNTKLRVRTFWFLQ